MTRKDYELLARTIKAVHDDYDNGWKRDKQAIQAAAVFAVRQIATDIALAISKTNKAFDLTRFLKDCGIIE